MTKEQQHKKCEKGRRYRAKHREKIRERQRKHNRKYKLKSLYGITPEQYAAMLAAQHFKCAICLSGSPVGQGPLRVDHCHSSGKIRGLLCDACNRGIGVFKDNTAALLRASDYLKASAA